MPDTVRITFLFALDAWVRWAPRPLVRWRVTHRCYREGTGSRYIRYRLQSANDTEQALAYEPDLEPWEEPPHA